jgi:hypothetical protein
MATVWPIGHLNETSSCDGLRVGVDFSRVRTKLQGRSQTNQRSVIPDGRYETKGVAGDCPDLLLGHRDVEPLLGRDQVIVVVVADFELDPFDLTCEPVTGYAGDPVSAPTSHASSAEYAVG